MQCMHTRQFNQSQQARELNGQKAHRAGFACCTRAWRYDDLIFECSPTFDDYIPVVFSSHDTKKGNTTLQSGNQKSKHLVRAARSAY